MKQKTVFVCTDCGTESPKWMGKCPGCGEWNTLEEITVSLKTRGDVDKDGALTSSDARTILRVAVGLEELTAATYIVEKL